MAVVLIVAQVALTCEAVINLVIHIILWPVIFMIFLGALLPWSESAAGGNYNLRYLSPAARKDLSPVSASQHQTNHDDLYTNVLYTLYVPRAGFLWSDSMVWVETQREDLQNSSVELSAETDEDWFLDEPERVFFQDEFVKRYPWMIQQIPSKQHDRRISQRVQTTSTVRLYDPTEARYLCVIPGTRVISEKADHGNKSNRPQGLDRIRVG